MNFNYLKTTLIALTAVTLIGGYSMNIYAKDKKISEQATEAVKDTKRAVKKAARKVKDETCELVNGKMVCVAKKVKHAAQNLGDKIEDAID